MKRNKIVLFVLVLTIVSILFSTPINQTLAWISNESKTLTNEFTCGSVEIELEETDTRIDLDGDKTTNTYLLDLQRKNILKDAIVKISANSEDCWVFVKIDKSENFDSFLEYSMSKEWNLLPGYKDVYFMEIGKSETIQTFDVLQNQMLTLKENISKDELNSLMSYPTLTFTGYAIQKEGIETSIEAWSLLKDLYLAN